MILLDQKSCLDLILVSVSETLLAPAAVQTNAEDESTVLGATDDNSIHPFNGGAMPRGRPVP